MPLPGVPRARHLGPETCLQQGREAQAGPARPAALRAAAAPCCAQLPSAYLLDMTIHQFTIERDPAGPHEHGYRAVEAGTGTLIPLPVGGGLTSTGAYPEVQQHLEKQGVRALLTYTERRGDTLRWDPDEGYYVWTFKTGGNAIVVRDPPRVCGEAEVAFHGS
jgi:hypothetical protein